MRRSATGLSRAMVNDMDEDGEDEPPHYIRNAPDDPAALHWRIVAEIEADLRAAVRRVAKGKKWEDESERLQLAGIAQAAMVVSALPVRPDESEDNKRLRLAAKHYEEALVARHESDLEWARGNDDLTRYLVDQFQNDIASPRQYSRRQLESPITHIGRAVIAAIAQANSAIDHANAMGEGACIPAGFDAESITVELVSAALRHTHAQSSLENIRWGLEERFAARRRHASSARKSRSKSSSARP